MTYNETLQTDKVQLWQNGIMAGLVTREEANDLLDDGAYDIINAQAIEWVGE